MPLAKFEKAKYFYVIYPGACGGNHVCNMISLCSEFNPRVDLPNYKEWLIKKYKQVPFKSLQPKFVNAHVGDGIHHVDRLYEYIPKEVEALKHALSLAKKGTYITALSDVIDNAIDLVQSYLDKD